MESNASFDSLNHHNKISNNLLPQKFIWPKEVNHSSNQELLSEPLIDLQSFYGSRDDVAATELVRSACLSHGLFQVINHGVDLNLINTVNDHVKKFFNLPIEAKMRVQRVPGTFSGYSFAHADRFSSNLPWKEIFSCVFHEKNGNDSEGALFFESAFGEEFEQIRLDFQNYCKAMKKLCETLMEILGKSLGVDKSYYEEFFKEGSSIMRCNFYPPCHEPALTLGTGPHCDPTAITILFQDQVGGLEVFADNQWKPVKPIPDALVVNLGDTFSALSNGVYKSCQHRAVVNKSKGRVSLVYFLCPNEDKVISPPQNLVTSHTLRLYPDFKWSDFLYFTQKHYRADVATLQNFTKWLPTSPPNLNPS